VGEKPPAHLISAAKKILKASEHGGRKVIKMRVVRTIPNDDMLLELEYVGVENLEIVVV